MTTDEDLSAPGSKTIVDGDTYVAVSGDRSCRGCAGENTRRICDALPAGCIKHLTIWVREEEVDELSEDAARAEFEQRAYQHYLDRKAAGKLDPTAEGDGTPEALFWKQEDGSYGVLMFNAAWQGFTWGRGLV